MVFSGNYIHTMACVMLYETEYFIFMQIRFLNIKTTVTIIVHETSVSLYIWIINKIQMPKQRMYVYMIHNTGFISTLLQELHFYHLRDINSKMLSVV